MPWQCHPPVHSVCTGDRFGVVIVIVIGVVVLICACDGDDGDYGCCCCGGGGDGKGVVAVVVVQLGMMTNRKRDAESSCCLGFFWGSRLDGTRQRTRFSAVGETLLSRSKNIPVFESAGMFPAFFLVGAEQKKIPFVFTQQHLQQ